MVEVSVYLEAQQFSDANGHVGIAVEVGIELDGVEQDGYQEHGR